MREHKTSRSLAASKSHALIIMQLNFDHLLNRTGCAFITVDALPDAISFYQKNGFKFLQASSSIDSAKDTIPMYYDLSQLL